MKPLPASGAYEARLRVTLKNSKQDAVRFSEPIVLGLELENLSDRALLFREKDPEVDFDFEVRNSQGVILPLKPLIADLKADKDVFGALLISLKPGEQREYEVDVNQVVDGLIPDTYWIVVSRHELYPLDESEGPISVKADPVKVVVLDAPQ